MADEERVEAGGKPVDLKKRREELQAAKANLKDAKRETAERISVLLDQYAEVGDASIKLAADMGRDLVTQARTGIDRQISSRIEGFRGAMTEYGEASDLMDKITARRQYIADHARAYKVDPTQDKTSRVVSTAQRIQNFAKRGVMQGVLKSARTFDAAHAILFGKLPRAGSRRLPCARSRRRSFHRHGHGRPCSSRSCGWSARRPARRFLRGSASRRASRPPQ